MPTLGADQAGLGELLWLDPGVVTNTTALLRSLVSQSQLTALGDYGTHGMPLGSSMLKSQLIVIS